MNNNTGKQTKYNVDKHRRKKHDLKPAKYIIMIAHPKTAT
jgi:hypothetical protein